MASKTSERRGRSRSLRRLRRRGEILLTRIEAAEDNQRREARSLMDIHRHLVEQKAAAESRMHADPLASVQASGFQHAIDVCAELQLCNKDGSLTASRVWIEECFFLLRDAAEAAKPCRVEASVSAAREACDTACELLQKTADSISKHTERAVSIGEKR